MGWLGFLAVVPWIQALIWAFKPTDVVDLRYLPKDVQRETDAMVARLKGEPPPSQPAEPHGRERRAMMVGFLVLAIACFVFWLVFLKLKFCGRRRDGCSASASSSSILCSSSSSACAS